MAMIRLPPSPPTSLKQPSRRSIFWFEL